jgi:hypothetical protein
MIVSDNCTVLTGKSKNGDSNQVNISSDLEDARS